MGPTLGDVLRDRRGEDWLIGPSSPDFWQRLDNLRPVLAAYQKSCATEGADVLITEADPLQFLIACLAAWSEDCVVVLANPRWGQQERQQVTDLVNPDWNTPTAPGLGTYPCQVSDAAPGQILIPTGGSSGQIKFAVHTWETLMASVSGFCAHFGVETVHAYCVLPLFHVSGLMQVLRVLATGGQLAIQPYGDLKRGAQLGLPPGGFLSLVPTQLQDLLAWEGNVPWLRSFRAVLLGGAPAGRSLLDAAQAAQIPVALTYGMTETAAQVATLRPEEFLAGHRNSGRPLPHVRISILDDGGRPQPLGEVGRVTVQTHALAWGYLGKWDGESGLAVGSAHPTGQSTAAVLATDDIGYFDDSGYLHIVGRRSTKLITGGENVFPEEVEAALLSVEGVQDGCVVGLPCDRWGQRLCALVVLTYPARLSDLPAVLSPLLAPYKRPKRWILISAMPRTAQGKLSRPQALTLAQQILGTG